MNQTLPGTCLQLLLINFVCEQQSFSGACKQSFSAFSNIQLNPLCMLCCTLARNLVVPDTGPV